MAGAVIGAIRVTLGIDTAAFRNGLNLAQRELTTAGKRLERIGDSVSRAGRSMTMNLTAPLALAGVGIVKFAGDFEAAMIDVKISSAATSVQLKQMNDLALDLGKGTVFSATEAASGMDMLAKNGLAAKDILGGAAKAAIDLAAAAGSELDPAAAAVTDTMSNFNKTTKDLPSIVNQITGAVNQSKFDFDDFRLAMGSAGGVAGKVGVDFEDFAAVLAGTSSSFSSGEDAGTSFKSMLLSIGSPSKVAQKAIDALGLKFFDATGKMKPMADIAQMLQDKLGKLSDEAKLSAIGDIFGSDGGRSALGLMQLGAKGLDDIAAKIAKTDAAAQAAARNKGFNKQLDQLKGSVETLAIRIGQSGILDMLTGFVTKLGDLVDRMSSASPAMLQFAVIFGAIVAAAGPLIVIIGSVISAIGGIATVVAPLIGEAGLVASLGTALGPIALAATAVYVAFKHWPEIQTWIAGVTDRMSTAGADINAKLAEMQKGADDFDKRMGIPSRDDFLGSIEAKVKEALAGVDNFLRGMQSWADGIDAAAVRAWQSFEVMWSKATGYAKALTTGVKQWLQTNLNPVFAWVGERVGWVADQFFKLYDAVVGHSYVPDMVDGIAEHFGRLEAVMVSPTVAAAEKTGGAFKDLKDRVSGLMDSLLPMQAAMRQAAADKATLDAALAKGLITKGGYDQATGALDRRNADDAAAAAGPRDPISVSDPGEIGGGSMADLPDFAAALDPRTQSRMSDAFRDIFSDGVHAALSGDLKGFFKGWIADSAGRGLESALGKLTGVMSKLFSGGGGFGKLLGSIGGLFGAGSSLSTSITGATSIAPAAPFSLSSISLPGLANGGTIKGFSGLDTNLLSINGAPVARVNQGEMIRVTKADNDAGRGGRFIVEPSPWFDVRAAGAAEPSIQTMGVRAAAGGAQLGARRSQQAARRRIPG